MGHKRCAWGTCTSDSRYPDRSPGVRFVPFVKPTKVWNRERCLRWIKACGRPHTQLNINKIKGWTYVCTKHFKDGWPSDENPDPLSAGTSENDQPKKRKLPWKRSQPPPPKIRKLTAARILASLGVNGEHDKSAPELTEQTSPTVRDSANDIAQESCPSNGSIAATPPGTAHHDVTSELDSIPESDRTDSEKHEEQDLTPASTTVAVEEQHEVVPKFDCNKCGHTNTLSAEQIKEVTKKSFIAHVLSTNEMCFDYTGVPNVDMLKALFAWIEPVSGAIKNWDGKNRLQTGRDQRGRKPYKLSAWECFLLTLIRIRKGFDVKHVSHLFCVSPSHVSRVFTLWVNVLCQCLKPLLKWPTQQIAKKNLPKDFAAYPNTRCIIDCTEFSVEKPFRPAAQKQTWSFYKHSNTTKLLVGIHPSGVITFLSKVYVGSISDLEIVKQSGFLALVEPTDDIMADRGFNIRHLLLAKKATLNIPAFSRGKLLSKKAVTRSRRIASLRIHVERAIRRMKCFKILSGVIPLKLRYNLNQILTVVTVLSNMDKPLCR